jgi:hypothetical protein
MYGIRQLAHPLDRFDYRRCIHILRESSNDDCYGSDEYCISPIVNQSSVV